MALSKTVQKQAPADDDWPEYTYSNYHKNQYTDQSHSSIKSNDDSLSVIQKIRMRKREIAVIY